MVVTSSDNKLSIITSLFILRDCIDGICDGGEQLVSALEEYGKRIEPYKDIRFSDDDVKEFLGSLSQDKISALLSALVNKTEISPATPIENVYKLTIDIKKDLDNLQRMRHGLHVALEDVRQ